MKIAQLIAIRKAMPVDSKAGTIQTKYKIARFMKATEVDEEFYRKEMQAILEKYAVRNEDGTVASTDSGNVPLQQEHINDFVNEAGALEQSEVESVPDIRFSIDELADFELSVSDLLTLDPILTE